MLKLSDLKFDTPSGRAFIQHTNSPNCDVLGGERVGELAVMLTENENMVGILLKSLNSAPWASAYLGEYVAYVFQVMDCEGEAQQIAAHAVNEVLTRFSIELATRMLVVDSVTQDVDFMAHFNPIKRK